MRRLSQLAFVLGLPCTHAFSVSAPPPSVVWLTGASDLRVADHGGLLAAAVAGGPVVPLFVLDDAMHLRGASPAALTRLSVAIASMDAELQRECGVPLIVRRGGATTAASAAVVVELAKEVGAATCHVVADDPVAVIRGAQREGVAALAAAGVEVARWSNSLRPTAPWEVGEGSAGAIGPRPEGLLPLEFRDYCEAVSGMPPAPPRGKAGALAPMAAAPRSDAMPTPVELAALSAAATPPAAAAARALLDSRAFRRGGHLVVR